MILIRTVGTRTIMMSRVFSAEPGPQRSVNPRLPRVNWKFLNTILVLQAPK